MRILVSGHTGQVSRALSEKAKSSDAEIISVGRPELDITDQTSISKALSKFVPDIVINAAAYTAVDAAEANETIAEAVNTHGASLLAKQTKDRSIPIIHFSTDYVFDGSKGSAYLESDPVAPIGVYGKTKRNGEVRVQKGNPHHVILRTAWVYSPFGQNFIKTMLRLADDRDEISVVADQRGAPTNALDLAEATLEIAAQMVRHSERASTGTFHMAGSGEAVWADFAEHIFNVSRAAGGPTANIRRIKTSEYPTPAKRPSNSVLDCSRLAATYGIELPDWHDSATLCVQRILSEGAWRQ